MDKYAASAELALLSSLATTIAGGALGLSGFIQYAQDYSATINRLVLESDRAAAAGPSLSSFVLQGMSATSVFAFAFTPAGLAAAYLTISGAVRSMSATFADAIGDPILTLVDALCLRTYRRVAAWRHRIRRESLEGPDVSDLILRGTHIGVAADLVVVCARRKRDWTIGTIVWSGDRWYRIGQVEERTFQGWLRTVYPLTEMRDHGVIRRRIDYTIPTHLTRQRDD